MTPPPHAASCTVRLSCGVFADYRLRVVQVLRDYGMFERDEAPEDSRTVHDAA